MHLFVFFNLPILESEGRNTKIFVRFWFKWNFENLLPRFTDLYLWCFFKSQGWANSNNLYITLSVLFSESSHFRKAHYGQFISDHTILAFMLSALANTVHGLYFCLFVKGIYPFCFVWSCLIGNGNQAIEHR